MGAFHKTMLWNFVVGVLKKEGAEEIFREKGTQEVEEGVMGARYRSTQEFLKGNSFRSRVRRTATSSGRLPNVSSGRSEDTNSQGGGGEGKEEGSLTPPPR